mmetsp:Transcript_35315/g.92688  ORF Transcript_35315/g.92688 Transcript_35315/m.92688 type:complete len:598 (+) Transcript_35315:45-1838(+)
MWGKGESVALAESAADAQARFNELVDLLVAAGYHRARISTLSPFDKIVGGMAWCMTATSVDVDVEFLENATIGQKIKIGENIERALKFMKCRIPLQAHQIQGLDYAAIFPVVQWLVKQAYAFREEIADATRRLSASQFDRNFELPADANLAMRRKIAIPTGQQLCACYAPSRRFRPKSHGAATNAALHARRVLMEFGTQLSALASNEATAADGAEADMKKAKGAGDDAQAEEAATKLKEALTDMAETNQDAEQAVSQSRIGKLVHMGASDIQQAAHDFAKKSEALLASGEMAAAHRLRGEREATERQLEQERRLLQSVTERAAAAVAARAAATESRDKTQEELAAQGARRGEAQAEMAELEARAASAPPDELAKLQELVATCERMNQQKSEFKRQCARQLEEMNRELEGLEQDQAVNADDDTKNLLEIERLHEAEESKASQMRRLVGQKGREIAHLHRQVDDIPTSAELMQYERRFRELYQQVASKLEETKKFYSLFNTLEEKKGYLSKEVSLLNSIHENYTKAAAGNKDRIAESVEGLLKSVQQNLQKVEQRLSDATSTRNTAQQRYDKLVEKQRKYFQLVKDYQTECQRNEMLAS